MNNKYDDQLIMNLLLVVILLTGGLFILISVLCLL